MRICLVSTAGIITPPAQYGGMERGVAWLARGLAEKDHEVTVIAKLGSDVALIHPKVRMFVAEAEKDFPSLFTAGEYDIIIDMSHDKHVTAANPDFPQLNVYQAMHFNPAAKNIVCISEGQRKHFGLNASNAVVIRYGLDKEEYPHNFIESRQRYVLYMGAISEYKRPEWVIVAAAMAGYETRLAGPYWHGEFAEKMKPYHSVEGVTFMGDVGGPLKIELLRYATAVIHPVGAKGWVEAGAIIALEAFAVGTPVIGTKNGCLPEYIAHGENGYLVESVEGIAEAIPLAAKLEPTDVYVIAEDRIGLSHLRMAYEYVQACEAVLRGDTW